MDQQFLSEPLPADVVFCLLVSGLSASVSGEHLSSSSPAVPGHAEGNRDMHTCTYMWTHTHRRCFCSWKLQWWQDLVPVSVASVHGQRWDRGGSAVQAAGSGSTPVHPQRRWVLLRRARSALMFRVWCGHVSSRSTRQCVGPEVSWCGSADRRPDAVLHRVPVLPAEEPETQRKPRLQSRYIWGQSLKKIWWKWH